MTAASELAVPLRLHERQEQAIASPARETLFGGAAGGGKSYLIRAAQISWCLQVPGLQCYLFRRHFDDLTKNHLEGNMNFHELLAPLITAGQAEIVAHQVRFYTGSRINLSHLQHKKYLM